MIEGVILLSENTGVVSGSSILLLFLLGLGAIGIGCCCIMYDDYIWRKIIAVIACLVVLVACIFGLISIYSNPKTYYKVMLDDSITFNEFNQYYEVINQEGLILTVRKR